MDTEARLIEARLHATAARQSLRARPSVTVEGDDIIALVTCPRGRRRVRLRLAEGGWILSSNHDVLAAGTNRNLGLRAVEREMLRVLPPRRAYHPESLRSLASTLSVFTI